MRCTFVRMNGEKRHNRGYKITDKRYKAAQRRAKKDSIPLATYIEMFVTLLGSGVGEVQIKDRGWLPIKSMAMDFIAGKIPVKKNKEDGPVRDSG